MSTDFRLEYTNGIEFIDLFPKTGVNCITDGTNISNNSVLTVTIPKPSGSAPNTQNVTITTTAAQVAAPFEVVLLSTGAQAEQDFGTISQMQVTTNRLTITRLYTMPAGSIQVALVFNLKRG